jgi:CPA2 family monovalent cation:H+ antiporter-2
VPHETALLFTVGAGLGLAFVFGFAAARLRVPPIVGYLIAGIAVGPHSPGFVADPATATQLAEIGVILLMFGVGLNFSLEDLFAIRRIALPGALVQMAVATALGVAVADAWGWPLGAGIVFGLSLSVASTVVLLRALEQRGILDTSEGRIAIGWLIVEDLAMVLALVLLPALAVSLGTTAENGAAGGSVASALAVTLIKVVAFFALMLLVGRRFVPWVLGHVSRTGSRELFTLGVLATALGIALGSAALFGVSVALGAFFAGMVISGSDLSYQAGAEALPLQDAFAVLFFVSVGMLFDPAILLREPLLVAGALAIVVFGKTIAACAIVLLLGYRLRTALTVSASLAQIGEFSFILAGLGMTLGLLPPEAYNLVLTSALLSIAINPAIFALINPLERWVHARPRLLRFLEGRTASAAAEPAAFEHTLRDHAIVVGYGRVGKTIVEALRNQSVPFVVIESDRLTAERARRNEQYAIWGDAARASVFQHARPEAARLLVLASHDPYQNRHIFELARRVNPGIDSVVRTHSAGEQELLEQIGAGRAILSEHETALAMARYALISLGQNGEQADAMIEWVREGVL